MSARKGKVRLKPCPFCGAKATVTFASVGCGGRHDDSACVMEPFVVFRPRVRTKAAAIRIWNTRTA
jgi:hypothetical protein